MMSPVCLGRWPISTRLGWPSGGPRRGWTATSRAALGSLELGVALLQADRDLLAGEPARQQLGLEPDQVIDEDDVVDQQLGQLQVAGRLGVSQPDRVERDPLARGELGRLGQRLRRRWSGRR